MRNCCKTMKSCTCIHKQTGFYWKTVDFLQEPNYIFALFGKPVQPRPWELRIYHIHVTPFPELPEVEAHCVPVEPQPFGYLRRSQRVLAIEFLKHLFPVRSYCYVNQVNQCFVIHKYSCIYRLLKLIDS